MSTSNNNNPSTATSADDEQDQNNESTSTSNAPEEENTNNMNSNNNNDRLTIGLSYIMDGMDGLRNSSVRRSRYGRTSRRARTSSVLERVASSFVAESLREEIKDITEMAESSLTLRASADEAGDTASSGRELLASLQEEQVVVTTGTLSTGTESGVPQQQRRRRRRGRRRRPCPSNQVSPQTTDASEFCNQDQEADDRTVPTEDLQEEDMQEESESATNSNNDLFASDDRFVSFDGWVTLATLADEHLGGGQT